VKSLKVWAGRAFWLLYAVVFFASPVTEILRSPDPLDAAIAYAIPLLAMLAIWLTLAFLFGFLQSRMPARAFVALNYTLAAVIAFGVLVIWRATERFGGRDGLVDDSWTAIVTVARMDNPALVIAGLAAPIIGFYGLIAALYGSAWLIRTRLAGDARVAAYLGLAALVALGVLVGMPALANHAAGKPFIDRNLAWVLVLWLGMVVPAAGVLVAYRRIGDGRS